MKGKQILVIGGLLGLALPALAREPVKKNPAKQAEIEASIPVCTGDADCVAKWEAAQLWVVHNAGFKLQTVTNVLLETYAPAYASAGITNNPDDVGRIFAKITKEPIGNGSYRIVPIIACLARFRPFGAQDECLTQDQTLDFNRTVTAAHAAAPSKSVTGGEGICPAKVVERLKQRGFSDQAVSEVCAE
ncbi:MAG TPA: hypothetical protein VH988_21790 [Thermoanaerobaculia bacterium]|jgi:hypothetical protein|nr:hypothetical protein [Thermoanaerobaculia bacterium]